MVFSKMSALITVVLMILVATKVAEGQNTPSCVSKLVPCAGFLNSTNRPPSSCCDPLREAVTKELTCLCDIYENPTLLPSLGINIAQALALPGRCGIPGDLSACKALAPGASSQHPPASPGGGNDKDGAGKIALTGLSSLLLVWASLMLC